MIKVILFETIHSFKKKYDFQYLDYFNSEAFTDQDFRDVTHLNQYGAEKFTTMLNNDINW
ncbi:hypothetical protein ACTFIN_05075 [Clostridium cagae]|uniref:hypothetical protein n=1 Tax=Clostridium cagae TaxID=2080751 RepID=UPI003F769D0C